METSTVNYADLGKKVMLLRKSKKMTQKELSEKAGVSPAYLGLIERGERKASLETIVSIANALDVGLNYLLSASLNNVSDELSSDLSLNQRTHLNELLDQMKQQLEGWTMPKEKE